jgi:hypothetical protein
MRLFVAEPKRTHLVAHDGRSLPVQMPLQTVEGTREAEVCREGGEGGTARTLQRAITQMPQHDCKNMMKPIECIRKMLMAMSL